MSKIGRYSADRKKIQNLSSVYTASVADCGTVFTLSTGGSPDLWAFIKQSVDHLMHLSILANKDDDDDDDDDNDNDDNGDDDDGHFMHFSILAKIDARL